MRNLLLALLFLSPFQLAFASTDFHAKVIRISDGDTITVLREGNVQVRVRLAEIDCPESGQPWGRKATDALKSAITTDIVDVRVVDTDRYGRLVAKVYIGPTSINHYMVESGNCWAYTQYVKDQTLFRLQEEARNAKRGLWQLPAAERVPPWEWRKK